MINKIHLSSALFLMSIIFFAETHAALADPTMGSMDEKVRLLQQSVGAEFENFFHVKYENIDQMTKFLEQKELSYQKSLSTCTPGTYNYGYIDMFPMFVQAKIEGWKNGKCIESSTHSPGVKLPSGRAMPVLTANCQYKPESIQGFDKAIDQKMKAVRKTDCQWYMNGKLITQ